MTKSFSVLFLACIGALLFIPFLGNVHLFDWDEINFAECAREMMKMNDYTRVYIDFQPFWEKPPLFFWMQISALKIFGVNEFAARLPNALCGISTLLVVFLCGARIYTKKFGMYWAIAYGGSLFPNVYFKSGIIDPWFNLFIFLSLYFFILYHWKKNKFDKADLNNKPVIYAVWSGIFMGLAILTKGPVALLIFLLVVGVYFILNRFRIFFGWKHTLVFMIVSFLITLMWYGYETYKNGYSFISEFLKYQYRLFSTHDAGQKGFPGYHFIVILFGCFPASIFAIPSFFKTSYSSRFDKDFKKWMLILFWVVIILFSLVQSRIIHYSSLAWFPVTFLAAYSFVKWQSGEMIYKKYISYCIAIVGGLITLLLIASPLLAINIKELIPYVKDPFAQANMQAEVMWSGWEIVPGLLLLSIIVAGLWRLKKRDYNNAVLVFFGGSALVIFLVFAMIVPKVERYSQGAAVDFFKVRKGEDCYVQTVGYKSYAHLFYTQKEKPVNKKYYDLDWLLQGDIDKPVYFVSKIHKLDRFRKYPDIKELYRKNGFVFLKREIPAKQY
jgi:hypothetical protein